MADISVRVEELDYPSDFDDDTALADELSLCRDQTKDVLYALAKSTEDNSPDSATRDESRIIVGKVEELQKALRQNREALADKIFRRCLSIFLKLKSSELVKRDAFIAGGIKEFQVPKISFSKTQTGQRVWRKNLGRHHRCLQMDLTCQRQGEAKPNVYSGGFGTGKNSSTRNTTA